MVMEVKIHGQGVNLRANQAIAKGGEADIFRRGRNRVVKLFKPPTHGDYVNSPGEQQSARKRLVEHQHKLPQFPQELPERVIVPETLVWDRGEQQILGYEMQYLKDTQPLMKWGDRTFREVGGLSQNRVVELFRDLWQTVNGLHQSPDHTTEENAQK
jgi:H/ACA ribonucleoprotein complex subunit 3